MDPFFLQGGNEGKKSKRAASKGSAREKSLKRRKQTNSASTQQASAVSKKKFVDEEIASSSGTDAEVEEDVEDQFANETADERRIRLARKYLDELDAKEAEESGEDDPDHDIISHRLKQEVMEATGRLKKEVAEQIKSLNVDPVKVHRGHQLSVTCMAVGDADSSVFTASKDGTIMRWNTETCQKSAFHKKTNGCHLSPVMALAASDDGKFLAAGCRDRGIRIWDCRSNELLKTLDNHRDAVSGLCFRHGGHQLFSASFDRTIKIWSIDDMAYIDTLFGHQSEVLAIDCLRRERPVTAGRDRTCRLWKVLEETHLVFRGHAAAIDCLALLNEDHFCTASQDGSLALWHTSKKKPNATRRNAHGGGWVSALAAYQYADVCATGSSDGFVRLWKTDMALSPVLQIPVAGYVNALAFASSGRFLAVGVGQEHRLGRWNRLKEGHNGLAIVPLGAAPAS